MSRYGDYPQTGYGATYGSNYEDTFAYNRNEPRTNDSGPEPQSLRSASGRSRDRRAGGFVPGMYGGRVEALRDDNTEEPEQPSLPRPTSLERTRANRRSGGPGWTQRSPTRRLAGDSGPGSKQIEEVLRIIQQDWSFMTEEKCVPIQVALQFMDGSSLGLEARYPRFRDLHSQLQSALRQIVNEQYQGFNSSIGRFHSIQAALQTSQHRLRSLKESLENARTSLSTTKPELVGLAKTSQSYDDMLMTLSDIEHLQGIPEQLEARLSEKRFLSAVDLLQEALKTIRKPSMDEIGALSELKVYLSNQEHSLTDILIEELHSHLYLKSPYCENRWKQHASSQVRGISRDSTSVIAGRELYQFLDQLDTETVLTDDPTKNPEADTFSYIHLLVESLNSLGRLDVAVESLAQRLPVELFRVVEKCSNEVDQRYPAALRSGRGFQDPLNFKDPARTTILNDLFGTLFARFEAIAEGHRVVHEVISGITKRDGTRGSSSLTGGFRELWKLYQSEIRSLLHDYLSSTEDTFRRRENGNRTNVFQKTLRDKSKVRYMYQPRVLQSLINRRKCLNSKTWIVHLVISPRREKIYRAFLQPLFLAWFLIPRELMIRSKAHILLKQTEVRLAIAF
jgi:exocyst complex component 4